MIFTGFKRKSNQFFFDRQLSKLLKNSDVNSSGKIKKVLIFLNDDTEKTSVLKNLEKTLNISKNKIKIIIFQQKVPKENTDENLISPKDFGWYGKITSEKLKDILTKKYDLLINYSKVDNLYNNLLLLQCKAAFKVGFSHLDNRFYNLLIKCESSNLELFNKELKKYLTILKKL
ncbi:hypothetical protein Lupro_00165 [Lutibacter profundi]|uniref:Uncharacterized protein n=1 Tax=Lutibacter profundi TaxID=1622118 RepID=A0A0X8G4Z9_9FLAO|nr:hypothetical protein [Lutibacter profundi]AMC09773.1 hypothetical protein Lupro_00165 [Lutibacter profundi]